MRRTLPLHPGHPERVCWGCDRYCAADDLRCGNGTIRTPHPAELFGPDWLEHGLDAAASAAEPNGAHLVDSDPPAIDPVQR